MTKVVKTMGKGNPANLVQNQPAGTYSPEQVREWQRKGGLNSAKSKREHKRLGDLLKHALTLDTDDEAAAEELRKMGLDPTFANAATLAAIRKAVHGDIEAARYIRDTIGEKPTEAMSVALTNKPVRAMDLSKMSDAELEALADKADSDH